MQGSLLDRIDVNIDESLVKVVEGNEFLVKVTNFSFRLKKDRKIRANVL
jgi:hypothetical protein